MIGTEGFDFGRDLDLALTKTGLLRLYDLLLELDALRETNGASSSSDSSEELGRTHLRLCLITGRSLELDLKFIALKLQSRK